MAKKKAAPKKTLDRITAQELHEQNRSDAEIGKEYGLKPEEVKRIRTRKSQ